MDIFSPDKRSWIMSKVKGKDTKPEKLVRSILHKNGFRFRLHVKDLPGKPDIVLPRYRVVIFVHGCFWHGHEQCKRATLPKTRHDFWMEKIAKNKQRDQMHITDLENLSYRCLIIWQCEIKDQVALKLRLETFIKM